MIALFQRLCPGVSGKREETAPPPGRLRGEKKTKSQLPMLAFGKRGKRTRPGLHGSSFLTRRKKKKKKKIKRRFAGIKGRKRGGSPILRVFSTVGRGEKGGGTTGALSDLKK